MVGADGLDDVAVDDDFRSQFPMAFGKDCCAPRLPSWALSHLCCPYTAHPKQSRPERQLSAFKQQATRRRRQRG